MKIRENVYDGEYSTGRLFNVFLHIYSCYFDIIVDHIANLFVQRWQNVVVGGGDLGYLYSVFLFHHSTELIFLVPFCYVSTILDINY